jgi:hypothetical protein
MYPQSRHNQMPLRDAALEDNNEKEPRPDDETP